jgi:hypothetical protein
MTPTPEEALFRLQQQAAALAERTQQRLESLAVKTVFAELTGQETLAAYLEGLHQQEEKAAALVREADRQLIAVEQATTRLLQEAEELLQELPGFSV